MSDRYSCGIGEAQITMRRGGRTLAVNQTCIRVSAEDCKIGGGRGRYLEYTQPDHGWSYFSIT